MSWFLLVRFLHCLLPSGKLWNRLLSLPLARVCSCSDSIILYQQTWETSSLLSFSGQSILCRQALLLQGRCPDIWFSNLLTGRSCVPLTRGPKIPWRVLCGPWGCPQTLHPRYPSAGAGADPGQAGFSASLINAFSGPEQLDWSSSCVPLTRGSKILWRVLWGPWECPQTPRPKTLQHS